MDITKGLPILMVTMPHVSVSTPSASLGLLHAILERGGHDSQVCYGNLFFAYLCGLETVRLELKLRKFNLGDWIFLRKTFPEAHKKQASQIDVLSRNRSVGRALDLAPGPETLEMLRNLIEQAEQYIDCLADRIVDANPRVVGFTLTVNQLYPTLALLKGLKDRNSRMITLLGGPYCETLYGLALHKGFSWIDYLVSGEADDIIVDLVTLLLKYGPDLSATSAPFGVLCPNHRRHGYPVRPDSHEAADFRIKKRDLEGYPTPDYRDYFRTLKMSPELHRRIMPGLPFEASRGCWRAEKSACLFCGDNGPRTSYQERPGKDVLATLDTLHGEYGITRFVATDNMMSLRLFDNLVPDLAARQEPYSIFFEITGALKAEQIRHLSDAGIRWLQPGIESLHTNLLKRINKQLFAWEAINTLKWCRQYGIDVFWNLLWGIPGDEDAWYTEMADIMPSIEHLQPPRLLNKIRYVPHSAYARNAEKFGLWLAPDTTRLDPMPVPTEIRNQLADGFHDRNEPDFLDMLLRSGFQAVKEKVRQWQKAFRKKPAPMLSMQKQGDRIAVKDSRSVATVSTLTLEGPVRWIFEEALRPVPPKQTQVFERLQNAGYNLDELQDAFARLLDRKLMLVLDGRCLALACDETSLRPMPPPHEDPSGTVLDERQVCL